MRDALKAMKDHDGILIKYGRTMWSWKTVRTKNNIPSWYCRTTVIEKLEKQQLVTINTEHTICKIR